MANRFLCASAIVLAMIGHLSADEKAPTTRPATEKQIAIARAVGPSLAQAEFTLQFDKGEPPRGSGWTSRCANCGMFHGQDCSTPVTEERPYEAPAFLLSATEVVTPDPIMHPRFIKSISVRCGNELVKATLTGYATDRSALFLKLEKPFKGAKPLEFDAAGKPPYMVVTYTLENGAWTTNVNALSGVLAVTRVGRKFLSVPSYCLIVDSNGRPVGMSMDGEIPVDDSWKGSPLKWTSMSVEQMARALDTLEKDFNRNVFLVKLNFRSPSKTSPYSLYESESGPTERYALAGLIGANTILVLADLKPKITARLQQITALPSGREPVGAKFAYTLKDYGAFVATLEKPLPGALVLYDGEITDFRNKLLLAAEVRIEGEKCTRYFLHNRIASFDVGWKRQLYPEVRGADEGLLLFNARGELVAFPIAQREKVAVGRQYEAGGGGAKLTPAVQLIGVKADFARHADASNVPLTEEQENRLAWLGVVLQPLNSELARINKVSDLTQNGRIGALVSYVYPGSPAETAKLQVGDVLIRLHVQDEPKPIDVRADDSGFSSTPFPWHRLDEVPEQYYDRIPRPWPPAENTLARALTDLGFGKKFVAEMSREGNVFRVDFAVTESPSHYDSAPKYKSDALGLTVRNLTYEVQRYFQKTLDDPGVIVSKIEPGSKASVAGMKPYEIITHVNDKPVMTVRDFEKLIGENGELRLSVKRMTKGRVVKIDTKSPAATQPAPEEE